MSASAEVGTAAKSGFYEWFDQHPLPLAPILSVAIVAVVTLLLCWVVPAPNDQTLPGVKMALPAVIDRAIGEPSEPSAAERLILPGDTEFAKRIYHTVDGDTVVVQIVLSGGERRSIHRPEVCLPAQGWTIHSRQIREIELKDGTRLRVMDLGLNRTQVLNDGRQIPVRAHFFYWFVGHHRLTPSHFERIFWGIWDRVVLRKNHRWAYVIVQSNVTEGLILNGRNPQQTVELLKQVTSQIAPRIILPRESVND